MQTTLIDPASSRWAAVVARIRHDFYHLPAYAAFATRFQERGTATAFVAQEGDDVLIVPLIVRSLDGVPGADAGLHDAISPRGYAGPVGTSHPGEGTGGFWWRAVETFRETLRDRGVVSAFVRLHPLLAPADAGLRAAGTVVHHGESVSIDLTLSEDQLWKQMRHDHRQGIRRARQLGLEATVDERWEAFDEFVSIYQESMERVGALEFWRLSRAYFLAFRESLGPQVHLCVVKDGERLAAAAILTEVDGIVEYHLAATADAYVRASPSKLLVDYARSWARARGNRVFHLGGSLRANDSLSQFKASFSPLRHDVESWRVIADGAAYGALVDAWERRHGAPADPPEGFFPAYRKPPAASR